MHIHVYIYSIYCIISAKKQNNDHKSKNNNFNNIVLQ